LVCLVPMLTMLPALLLQGRGRTRLAPSGRKAQQCPRTRLEQAWLKRPRLMVLAGLAMTLLAASQIPRVRFDYNLLNLQSQSLSAIVYERKMVESSSHAVLSCLVMADSVDEALALEKRIRALDSVAGVDSMAPFIAGEQQEKLGEVREIQELAARIRFAPMDTQPVDPGALDSTLASFNQVLGGAAHAVHRSGDEALREELVALRGSVEAWREAIDAGPPGSVVPRLTHYQQALFTDLDGTLEALKQQEHLAPLRADDLPAGLRSRFIGRTGKLLLQVYPKENVWERGPQQAFVQQLRTVDPAVTGPPVRFYEFTGLLKLNFQKAALYALITITLMLLSHFRNLICVALALLPVLVGMVWMLGAMAVLGIAFNPANIIAITLLIGIGVSSGVHILNRFTEQRHPSILGKSTGKAVLVSALTTVAGFGSLMLAEHEGIASLGQVMALGAAMCVLAALTVLPALLLWLNRSGWKLAHGWLSHSAEPLQESSD